MGEQRFSVVPSRAVGDKDMPDNVFRTLAALGLYGDKNGWCFPSLRALAEIRGLSRSTISRHIKLLEERGYLNVHKQRNEDGSRAPNLVQIRFDFPPDKDKKGGVALKDATGVAPYMQQGVALKDATLTPQLTPQVNDSGDANASPRRKRRAGGEGNASPFKPEKASEQKDTRESKKPRARKGKKEKVPAEILRAAVTAWAVVTGIITDAETPVPEPVYPRLAREAKRALTAKRKALGGAAWPEVLAALQADLRVVYRGWWAWDGRESAPGHQQVHELLARVWAGTWPEYKNRPKGKRKKTRPAASVEELADALGI